MSETIEPYVSRLTEYSEDDASELGTLMTHLSDKFIDRPIDKELLEAIIQSPYHEQLVARFQGRIVGAATLSIVMGAGAGRMGYLMDFVTDPDVRGQGLGKRLWADMMSWCSENDVNLTFTSRPERAAAHEFYVRSGAEIRDTTVFLAEPSSKPVH